MQHLLTYPCYFAEAECVTLFESMDKLQINDLKEVLNVLNVGELRDLISILNKVCIY